jgi:hypothetical protein
MYRTNWCIYFPTHIIKDVAICISISCICAGFLPFVFGWALRLVGWKFVLVGRAVFVVLVSLVGMGLVLG